MTIAYIAVLYVPSWLYHFQLAQYQINRYFVWNIEILITKYSSSHTFFYEISTYDWQLRCSTNNFWNIYDVGPVCCHTYFVCIFKILVFKNQQLQLEKIMYYCTFTLGDPITTPIFSIFNHWMWSRHIIVLHIFVATNRDWELETDLIKIPEATIVIQIMPLLYSWCNKWIWNA